ncbi:hypothetical protein, partial [Serratia liquefaciens]|uniref:hypothetical protein n=1 Tax=Serratia liquefaciens TaxID=614 RepID=UPI00235DF274
RKFVAKGLKRNGDYFWKEFVIYGDGEKEFTEMLHEKMNNFYDLRSVFMIYKVDGCLVEKMVWTDGDFVG